MNPIEDTQPTSASERGPLALHIARLRQWYGDKGLAQNELADLAGISTRLLRKYETCRRLPPSVEMLLLIAFALQRPVEQLVDPRLFAELGEGVAKRRAALEGEPEREPIGFRDQDDEQ